MEDKNDDLNRLYGGYVGTRDDNGNKKYVIGANKVWLYLTEEQLHEIHMGIHEVLKKGS